MLKPAGRATRTSSPGCARSPRTAARSSPTARCCPQVALDIPAHGWVNLHFSLLPAWRGAAPVQHAVLAGDEVTGASTFLIEEGLDSGPVYGVVTEEVRPADTSGDLLTRLALRRRRAARGDHGRHRGRHAAGRAAAGRGRHARPEDQRRGRPGRLDGARAAGRPRSSAAARPPPAPGRSSAASGSSCAPGPPPVPDAPTWRPGSWPSARTRATPAPAATPSNSAGCSRRARSR